MELIESTSSFLVPCAMSCDLAITLQQPFYLVLLIRFGWHSSAMEWSLTASIGFYWASLVAQRIKNMPGMGRSPGEGKGYPLQYFGLENSMDCIVH